MSVEYIAWIHGPYIAWTRNSSHSGCNLVDVALNYLDQSLVVTYNLLDDYIANIASKIHGISYILKDLS